MNLLITSASSLLGVQLADAVRSEHALRLTDFSVFEGEDEVIACAMDADESTESLVAGMEAIVHLTEPSVEFLGASSDPDGLRMDICSRRTDNLLTAAVKMGVGHCVVVSTLHLFDLLDPRWVVNENWRPRPSTNSHLLCPYVAEFVCREFAREGKLSVTCLRMGDLVASIDEEGAIENSFALLPDDASGALRSALEKVGQGWNLYHVQSDLAHVRSSTKKAKGALRHFNP